MPDALYFTDDDAANKLIARNPLALLIGFVLDRLIAGLARLVTHGTSEN